MERKQKDANAAPVNGFLFLPLFPTLHIGGTVSNTNQESILNDALSVGPKPTDNQNNGESISAASDAHGTQTTRRKVFANG